MSPEKFNEWRREHDYPRILVFFKQRFAQFQEWQTSQDLSDAELFEFGLGRFIRPESQLFIYRLKKGISPQAMLIAIDFNLQHRPDIEFKKRIVPYLTWAKNKGLKVHPEARDGKLGITGWYGRTGASHSSAAFMRDLELLYAGGLTLNGANGRLGGRLLDFLNLDGLTFTGNLLSGQQLHLYYCSAQNLVVRASIPFVYAYRTAFHNLRIEGVRLQDWHLDDCEVWDGSLENVILFRSSIKNCAFSPMLLNVEFHECEFSVEPRYASGIQGAFKFYSMIKRAYAAKGQFSEAGKYFLLEKRFERGMLLHPLFFFSADFPPKKYNGTYGDLLASFREGVFDREKTIALGRQLTWYYITTLVNPKFFLRAARYWLRYISSLIQSVWWGYGEKPSRLLLISSTTILGCTAIYFIFGSDPTRNDPLTSLYFSVVTFTTLGYGDVVQHGSMRLVAAAEALLGALNMGMFVASLAQKSRY